MAVYGTATSTFSRSATSILNSLGVPFEQLIRRYIMPICEGCGGSYDNQFKFCPHCGRAKPEPATLNINVTSDDVWETCEINLAYNFEEFSGGLRKLYGVSKVIWRFEATAIGPQGRYGAAWSEILQPLKNGIGDYTSKYPNVRLDSKKPDIEPSIDELIRNNCRSKVDNLIKKLVTDGWQPIGRGQEWYSERFRRKIKE